MRSPDTWQCSGCTGFTSQFTRLEFLDAYDARFVIAIQGPIDEALAHKDAPAGWPQSPAYSRWAPSEDYARYADIPG